jgi:hypothetical protein
MYSTMNDRFFAEPAITDPQFRKNYFEELQAETRANDAQVLKTNVRMGNYQGWKPKPGGGIAYSSSKSKLLPPKSSMQSTSSNFSKKINSSQNLVYAPQSSLIGRMESFGGANTSNAPDAGNGLLWNESTDMFKTTN